MSNPDKVPPERSASLRQQLFDGKSLDEIADFMSQASEGSINDQAAKAEFLLRQTQLQTEVAEAAKDTAIQTQRYTLYMLWSVVILALSAVGSFVMSVLTYLK